jgi:Fe-S-cluster containining protein
VSRLGELHAKVDAFFARVEARHGEDMQCQTGCSDCCRVRLTITSVEAAAIADEVARWPAERRRALTAADPGGGSGDGPGSGPGDRCAALDAAGRCRIYAARPIVCRSHGVPIRLRRGALPVVEACFRNFTRTEPAADCVLDQTTLSALTLAIDREAGGDGSRVDLAALLADLADLAEADVGPT